MQREWAVVKKIAILLMAAVLIVAVPFLVAACGGEEEPAPAETTEAAETPVEEETAAMKDIVDTAVEAGDFTTLITALTEAGLYYGLKGEGPHTVFAPTDAAFEKLPDGTLEALLEDPTGQLTEILFYHVVPGKVMSTDLSDGMTATTVQGDDITITIAEDGTVMVNDAVVTTADIETSNGVIHVIDSVLLPPEK